MKKFFALLGALCLLLTGCSSISTGNGIVSGTDFAFDTTVSIQLYGDYDPSIVEGAIDLCKSYEQIFSRTDPDSELYRLNAGEITEVSPELSALIQEGLYYAALSGGAFDITTGALSDLWQFGSDEPHVPSAEAIATALAGVGYEKVSVEGSHVTLPEGTRIDLGAIAKGYIADRIRDYLAEQGVTSAIINLGGNLYCLGSRPDGTAFRVGIQYPYKERDEVIAAVEVSDLSVVTSGVYERYFEEDGVLYHHILNTDTGYPADTGLLAVSILSPSSTQADALSTACFALGLEEGMALVDSIEDAYAIFITEDLTLHYSEGLQEAYPVEARS